MRGWLVLTLAATLLACSGGRDPVGTVGGDREYEGPGASEAFGPDDQGTATTSMSTLFALCLKACAHLRAKDCDGAPAHTADECWTPCFLELKDVPPTCSDEAAAVYSCSIGAKVTCSGMLVDVPMVTACEDEESDLQKCLSPGSSCVVSPQVEITCISLDLPTFMFCSEGVMPPSDCFQISATGFCCP
jgi:hypothetical protein